MPTNPEDSNQVPRPEIPDHLEKLLTADKPPEDQVELPDLPGKCPIHGDIGFGRFIMHDRGKIISEHCAQCLSRIFTALVGVLEYDE